MSTAQITEIGQDLIYTALLLAMPTLLISLVVGLIVSILQTRAARPRDSARVAR